MAGVAAILLALLVFASNRARQPDASAEAFDTIGTPVLQVDRDHVDFGDVPFNQMVEATFELTNTGDAALLFAEEPFIELKDGC